MNNHHQGEDEDEDEVQFHVTQSRTNFNLDDAFSDNDDDADVTLKFTPEAIREDLAKNFNASHSDDAELDDLAGKIGFAVDPDASVSTFDIDAPAEDSHFEVATPPLQPSSSSSSQLQSQDLPSLETMDEIALSSSFSHISLSDDKPSALRSPPAVDASLDSGDASDDEHAQYASYPAVQIDVSEPIPTPREVKLSPTSAQKTATQQQGNRSLDEHEEDRPETPSSSRVSPPHSAASTSSLPLPTSSSAPVPSTSGSGTSIAANIPRHRGTRSVGPSALDKVISKTRPSFLPPKNRSEDRKHMADWEAMMKRSRTAGESCRI